MKSNSVSLTIDVRRLRVLRELRERETIAAAAEALCLTPSAISQQIANLAREIGVPLLAPSGRRVRLTPQALILLEHAVVIDAALERARADLAAFDDTPSGRVTIGAFATAITTVVAPILPRLRLDHPDLTVVVREIEAPDAFTLLNSGELDIVITVDHRGSPRHGDPRHERYDLFRDPMRAVLPAGHPLADEAEIDLRSLASEAWIIGAERGPCGEVAAAACVVAGFAPDVRHRVNDWAALLALVAAGCGVALVPRAALTPAAPAGIVVRPIRGETAPARAVHAATRAGAGGHPSLAVVLEALRDTGRAWSDTRDAFFHPTGEPCRG